jgi:hypothetical protein
MKRKIIFSAKLAKRLINEGFKILDIEPNKLEPSRTVFFFERTDKLEQLIAERTAALKK